MRRLTMAGVAVAALLGANEMTALAQEQEEPRWLVLQVDSVRVATQRPGNAGTWDGEAKEDPSACGLAKVGGAALGGAVSGGVGAGIGAAVGGFLCELGESGEQQERDPKAPDLMLRLSADGAKPYYSSIVLDTYYHDFTYKLVIPLDAIPRAGLKLAVLDQDGAAPRKGEVLGSLRLSRAKLVELAASDSPVRTLSDAAVERLELVVMPYRRKARTGSVTIDAGDGLKGTKFAVLAGEIVKVEAAGSYEVTMGQGRPLGPEGYTDGSRRGYNIDYGPLASGPHAAAVASIGGAAIITGKCRTWTAPYTGHVTLGINDRDPGNNSGRIKFRVTARPPSKASWQNAGTTRACAQKQSKPAPAPRRSKPAPSNAQLFRQRHKAFVKKMRTYERDIRQCFKRVLRTNPRAEGWLKLHVTIGSTGHVAAMNVDARFGAAFKKCVQQKAKKWRFDRRASQETFRFPLWLKAR